MFQVDEDTYEGRQNRRYADPDIRDAWDELNEFLETGTSRRTSVNRNGSSGTTHGGNTYTTAPKELKKDYELLQVPFGAPFPEVKKSYKKLIIAYHPDHHANDTAQATEMTQKINYAFQRIKKYEETGKL
jgi:DnaJ-domain-containing protein 1